MRTHVAKIAHDREPRSRRSVVNRRGVVGNVNQTPAVCPLNANGRFGKGGGREYTKRCGLEDSAGGIGAEARHARCILA